MIESSKEYIKKILKIQLIANGSNTYTEKSLRDYQNYFSQLYYVLLEKPNKFALKMSFLRVKGFLSNIKKNWWKKSCAKLKFW